MVAVVLPQIISGMAAIESSTCFSSSDIVRGGLVSDRFDGSGDFENETVGL